MLGTKVSDFEKGVVIHMQMIADSKGYVILHKMVEAIQGNKVFLGDVDGLVGDGDHGMNMNKGFSLFESRFGEERLSFSQGLSRLGEILMEEIGGSMGPIYGTVFTEMAEAMERDKKEKFALQDFTGYLEAGLTGLYDIVEARTGDKTLVDTLAPAVEALQCGIQEKRSFAEALCHMKQAAEEGKESTKDMVAKFGRSSRLGERSRGVYDAGACSCALLLQAMADGMLEIMEED